MVFINTFIRSLADMIKYDILIILVDFYMNLSHFFLLPGSGSTFPEVDLDPANEVDPGAHSTTLFFTLKLNMVYSWC